MQEKHSDAATLEEENQRLRQEIEEMRRMMM
jgi:hypothetical protein